MFVILSRFGGVKLFEILRPFSKATEKTSIARFLGSLFALDQLYLN